MTALEVAWRWLFGIPFLAICWMQARKVLSAVPPENAGLTSLNLSNPWLLSIKLATAWEIYEPHALSALRWLAPAAAVAWVVVSALGRNLVMKRMEPRIPFRPIGMAVLQAASLGMIALAGLTWYRGVGWAAATKIGNGSEPDLVGYTVWVVFLSLGLVSVWAVVSWVVTIAPVIALLEDCGAGVALARSFKLGRGFAAKLVEINFVMSIVRLALVVLAMVFSSVLIPFSGDRQFPRLHCKW